MLTLNDFAEGLRNVYPESILLSAVPKPEVDFVTDLVKQQTNEVPENLSNVYNWIRNTANVEDFLKIYLLTNLFSKEKISKIELLTKGQNNNKL